ncbi:hypothetical protein AMAG_12625 [Allomyces macrogynus ATCC 38327]|uniref:Uncharacterized protein n=1 Tax=Allomyces macrogynus (strain ATCC 38327) TaxID=578462 RepID=A0A0L0SZD1_ALLM3|nr:hypothetical protein AMAG_12625 [Allomyces macrogynus ATCC 38327]|eukprot:KNE67908.1 hypothetical protein AMAG_12625 [Allomyces macrogynus ATCC 38327]
MPARTAPSRRRHRRRWPAAVLAMVLALLLVVVALSAAPRTALAAPQAGAALATDNKDVVVAADSGGDKSGGGSPPAASPSPAGKADASPSPTSNDNKSNASPSPSPSKASPSPSPSPSPTKDNKADASPTSNNKASPSPTSTDDEDPENDPCKEGRCVPKGKKVECLVLSKIWTLRTLTNAYLPVDVRPYFQDRFAEKYDPTVFPSNFTDITMFMNLWGSGKWSLVSNEVDFYNERMAGCKLPDQRYYISAFLVDIITFFKNKQDPCSVDSVFPICAATMDARAALVQSNLDNATLCNMPAEYKAKGAQYVTTLKTSVMRSSNADTCLSGDTIEGGMGKCGYWSQFSACVRADSCTDLDPVVKSQCPTIITNWKKQYLPNAISGTLSSSSDSSPVPVAGIIMGVAAAGIVVVAFVAMNRSRSKSGESPSALKSLGRSLSRTIGRRGSGGMRDPGLHPMGANPIDGMKPAAPTAAMGGGNIATTTGQLYMDPVKSAGPQPIQMQATGMASAASGTMHSMYGAPQGQQYMAYDPVTGAPVPVTLDPVTGQAIALTPMAYPAATAGGHQSMYYMAASPTMAPQYYAPQQQMPPSTAAASVVGATPATSVVGSSVGAPLVRAPSQQQQLNRAPSLQQQAQLNRAASQQQQGSPLARAPSQQQRPPLAGPVPQQPTRTPSTQSQKQSPPPS